MNMFQITKPKRFSVLVVFGILGLLALRYLFTHTFSFQTQPWDTIFFIALFLVSATIVVWSFAHLFVKE